MLKALVHTSCYVNISIATFTTNTTSTLTTYKRTKYNGCVTYRHVATAN